MILIVIYVLGYIAQPFSLCVLQWAALQETLTLRKSHICVAVSIQHDFAFYCANVCRKGQHLPGAAGQHFTH